MHTDDLVQVLVPRRYLSQVYGFISRLDGEVKSHSSDVEVLGVPAMEPGDTGASEVNGDEWTQSRLRRMVEESPPAVLSILAALAEKPGEWLSTKDLAASIGTDADWKTVAGTLGAFARRLTSRYGLEKFPFENRYDHAAKGRLCRMSDEMARTIQRLIAERRGRR